MAPKKAPKAPKAAKKSTKAKPMTTTSFPKKAKDAPPVYDLSAGESLPSGPNDNK